MKLPHTQWGTGARQAVLLHGFTGNHDSWVHLEPLLGDVIRASCVDLPGHSHAPLPSQLGEAGFIETVRSIGAELPQNATLIGYSQGARVALAVALAVPERVSRLILESGSPGIHTRRGRARRRAEDEQRAVALEQDGLEPFINSWECVEVLSSLETLDDASKQALRARRLSHTAAGLAGALRCLGQGVQPSRWDALPTLRIPVLVISGVNDVKYDRIAARMAAQLPLAWRARVTGCGHAPHLENPTAYAREVRDFITAQWADTYAPPPVASTSFLSEAGQ